MSVAILAFGLVLGGKLLVGSWRRPGLDRFELFVGAASRLGLLLGEQGLTVGDRDLIVIGVDFRKGEEALPVAAVFDEGRLQRRLDARHLGEIDISLEGPLAGGFEIKFVDLLAVEYDHPGLLRATGVYQHALGHYVLRGPAAGAGWRGEKGGRGGSRRLGVALWHVGARASPPAALPLDRSRRL